MLEEKRSLRQGQIEMTAYKALETELKTDHDAPSILGTLGPKPLTLLTSDRTAALNRADQYAYMEFAEQVPMVPRLIAVDIRSCPPCSA